MLTLLAAGTEKRNRAKVKVKPETGPSEEFDRAAFAKQKKRSKKL
jgi:hypothetical protein